MSERRRSEWDFLKIPPLPISPPARAKLRWVMLAIIALAASLFLINDLIIQLAGDRIIRGAP